MASRVKDRDALSASRKKADAQARLDLQPQMDSILTTLGDFGELLHLELDGTSREGSPPQTFKNADGNIIFTWGRLAVKFIPTAEGIVWESGLRECGDNKDVAWNSTCQLTAGQHALMVVERQMDERPWLLDE